MSKWQTVPIVLTAGQVTGANAVVTEEPIATTGKTLRAVQSRSAATAMELFFGGAAVGVAGQGIPLAAGGRIDFHGDIPFNGSLWIIGGLAAEVLVLIYA